MSSDKLHIKLGLSGTYWDRRPEYRVSVNDTILLHSQISSESDIIEYHEFTVDGISNSSVLKIELLNKQNSDTVQSEDKTQILKDMLLNIHSISVDGVDMGVLLQSKCEYRPIYPLGYTGDDIVHDTVNLGWNGSWTIAWTNPYFIWLLENL
jgi:hypothetical protein